MVKNIMRNQFLNVEVADDMPFEIEIKHFWGSPIYKFEPKDNLKLQILLNQRMRNRVLVMAIILVLIFFASIIFIECFFEVKRASSFLALSTMIFPLAEFIVMRKKYYFISEK